jgi:hypothetical protein
MKSPPEQEEGSADGSEDRLWKALRSTSPFASLAEIVKEWKAQGCTQKDAESRLTAFVDEVRAKGLQDQEDPVLDVLDVVVGWCSPQTRLFP